MTGTFFSLRDGARIVVRPIEPGDKGALVEGFEHLSERSRYRRFLSPTTRLTDAQLHYLTEVDHVDHEALIAFAEETGEPIGVARYVRFPDDPEEAEPAVTVVDEWQGRGVGTVLLDAITERARDAGVKRFVASVLADNKPMIAMLEHLGSSERERVGGGVMQIESELPEKGAAPSFRAALRDAAAERLALVKSFLDLGHRRDPSVD